MSGHSDERIVADPTPVWIRHVRRAEAGETRTVSVLRATFAAAEGDEFDALHGKSGWQEAEVQTVLANDGTFRVRMPNSEGSDGRLHRERFAVRTDDEYRMGEEWLEVYREPVGPDTLLFVGTPAKYRLTTSTLELSGPDITALFSLARAGDLDIWRDAPRDVIEHYTRLPVVNLARSFHGWTDSNAPADPIEFTADGWQYDNVNPGPSAQGGVTPAEGVLELWAAGTSSSHLQRVPAVPIDSDAWTVDARMILRPWGNASTTRQRLQLSFTNDRELNFDLFPRTGPQQSGRVVVQGSATVVGNAFGTDWAAHHMEGRTRRDLNAGGGSSMRIVRRGAWVFCFLEGELLARARLVEALAEAQAGPTMIRIQATELVVDVYSVIATSLAPYGLRGADKGDRHLPGAPAPGGLRGRYYAEAASRSSAMSRFPGTGTFSEIVWRDAFALDPLEEPAASRLDSAVAFAIQAPATWQPPATQIQNNAFSVIWTGAIQLDLSAAQTVRVSGLHGRVRVYIGKTRPGEEVIDGVATPGTLTSGDLRTHLPGSPSGWYSLRIEYIPMSAGAGLTFEIAGSNGVYTTVPQTRLSPAGCFEDQVRHESHREVIDRVTEAFGFQWRVEYRTLESGEFPGQLIPRVRAGRDTDKIINSDHATDLAVESDAADAVDAILIDAAGIADPKGAEQLTVEAFNFATLGRHMFLATGFESLAETTEQNQLEQRAESIVQLRAGPNETIAARPASFRDEMTDTFPLTGVLARLRWRPGDGVRLALADLSAVDLSPRQLLSVGWGLWPDGSAPPVIGYRQRPRGVRTFMRRTLRAALTPRRSYQGQSAVIVGGLGSVGNTSGQDAFSRLPVYEHEMVSLHVDVTELTAGASATLVVNSVNTGLVVTAKGAYPIDRWATSTANRQFVTVTNLTAGAAIEFTLRARIRI